jgi:hypothetical protein
METGLIPAPSDGRKEFQPRKERKIRNQNLGLSLFRVFGVFRGCSPDYPFDLNLRMVSEVD